MNTDFESQINIAFRARITLIIVMTIEEDRAIRLIKGVCETASPSRQCVSWDISDGFSLLCGRNSPSQAKDPLQALDAMEKTEDGAVIIFKDFHEFWNNSQVKRKIRNFAQKFKFSRRSIVIITPALQIPDELRDEAITIHFLPPPAEELSQELEKLIQGSNVPCTLSKLGKEKIIQAALGMTLNQARRSFSKAIVTHGGLDDRNIEEVIAEKKDILSQSQGLEFYGSTETIDNVGGLSTLKRWLMLRERAFTHQAREYGLPAPKGIALIGIPGTGKSLTAKMIAGLWKLPLLRLDVGSLFGSLVGESEERTRRALTLAETIAPCILWIDEMEKAFSFGSGDSGTSQRVFASLLTWMQDKSAPCFVVATANNISALPPELLRKGRFDEIFFLDLPNRDERKEIFSVHLKKRNWIPAEFDLDLLVQDSEGYVGAEIEQTIIDAMYLAFNQGLRKITTDDIASCLKQQVPLSRSQRETVEMLRRWLHEGRALSASEGEVSRIKTQGNILLEPYSSD